jgi:hypothetical protein
MGSDEALDAVGLTMMPHFTNSPIPREHEQGHIYYMKYITISIHREVDIALFTEDLTFWIYSW